jgi:iron complex transport system substrate-binding protein
MTRAGVDTLILIAVVGLIGVGLDRWTTPVLGPPLASHGYGISAAALGSREYPRELVDSDGFRVRIPAKPQRIVSQYWSIDEYLYSVVPPERVVGVSESAYIKGVSNVLDFVSRFHPVIASDPERVLRQDPDLILVSSSSRNDFTSLVRSSGIPIYRMFIDFHTLEQIEQYIRLTGYLTGEDEHAEQVAERFHADVEHAKSMRPPNARRPRVMGLGGSYSYGAETLFDDIVNAVGGVNVAAAHGLKGYDLLNDEQIARWNPEWIIVGVAAGQLEATRDRILASPGIALTDAGRNKHVVLLENRVFLPMSPFTAQRVTAIAEALWK